MAKRKLNTKFIAVLGGVALAIAVLGAGYWLARPQLAKIYHSLTGQSTAVLEKQGDAAVAAGDYEKAVQSYGIAAGRSRTDTPLQLKYVDAFDYTVDGDAEKFRKLHDMYMQILQSDNTSAAALERLMRIQLTRLQGAPSDRANANTLKQTADRILKLQPDNRAAKRARVAATLEPYLLNLEVPPEEVAEQKKAAGDLFEADPKDGEALLLLVRFDLKDAQDAAAQNDRTAMHAALDKGAAEVQKAIAADSKSAAAYLAKLQIDRAQGAAAGGQKPEQQKKLNDLLADDLEKADSFAKPGDNDLTRQQFLTIRAIYLKYLETRDPKNVEQRYRQLLNELPNDRRPRLMLAAYLARTPARIDDAIGVLEKPWQPSTPLRAMDSLQQKQLGYLEQARINMLRLDKLETITDQAARKPLLAKISESYKTLASTPDVVAAFPIWLLRIEAGLALAREDLNSGIAKLDAALTRLPPEAEGETAETRNDVLLDLAKAYQRLGQTGSARPLLVELVKRTPFNLQARLRLAELLIGEQRYEDARQQVEFLQKALPGNPVVEQLNIKLAALRPGDLRKQYVDYPEATREQRVIKITAAGALGDAKEVERLAKLMLDENPADSEAAVVYVQSLIRAGEKEKALAALNKALAAKPDEARLQSLRDMLGAQTADAKRDLQSKAIEKISDPYERNLVEAEVLRRDGKIDESIALLEKAQADQPDDARAPQFLFNLLIGKEKYDQAEKVVDNLSRLNADQTYGELTRARLVVARSANAPSQEARTKSLQTALNMASSTQQKYPQIAATTLLRAQLLQQLGRFEQAVDEFAQVLVRAPTNVEALRGSIGSLLALRRSGEAKRQLEAALTVAPNDPALKQLELQYNLNFDDPEKAIDTLAQTLKQRPNDPQAWGQLGAAYEEVAAAKTRGGKDAEAEKFLKDAAKLYRDATDKFQSDLRFPRLYAAIERRLGNAADAEKIFEQVAASDAWKDRPEAKQLLADQYAISGKPEKAEAVLLQLIDAAKPPPVEPLILLSRLYVQQNRLDAALALLDQRKDDPAVMRQRIELLIAAGKLDAARSAIEEALAAKPSPELYVTAAIVELRSGKIEKADGFLNNALREQPDNPTALFYRAQVHTARQPPELLAAKADLQRVLQLSGGNLDAHVALANVLQQQGDTDGSIAQLQAAWAAGRSSKPVLLQLVNALLANGQTRDAEQAVSQAKENPLLARDQDVILADANVTLAAGNTDKAMALGRQAYAIDPKNATLRDRYYDLLLRGGAYKELLSSSEAVVKENAENWPVLRQRGIALSRMRQRDESAKTLDAAMNAVVKQKNYAAIRLMAETIASEISPKSAAARLEPLVGGDPTLRMLLANIYQRGGDVASAVQQYERVLADRSRLSPEQLKSVRQQLASAYMVSAQGEKALKLYNESLALTPNDLLLLNNIAYLLATPGPQQNLAKAEEYAKKAYDLAQQAPDDAQARYVADTYGWVLVQNGHLNEGLEVLRKVALTAKFPEAHLHLAEALLSSGDVDSAEIALGQARRIVDSAVQNKQPVDPAVQDRIQRVAGELKAKRTAAAS